MNPTKPRRLVGTSIYLAGTKVNLGNPKTIEWLKAEKIKKVFCLYPLTQKQFGMLSEPAKRGASTIDFFYRGWGIDPMFVAKLSMAGIRVSSIWRSPDKFRENASFLKEAVEVTRKNGRFLIQCFTGKHASGAYAMYYLANATDLNFKQIQAIFHKSGLGKDISRIEHFLSMAKIDIKDVIKRREAMGKVIGAIYLKAGAKQRKKKKRFWQFRGKIK